ncbi:MAG: multidrug efflux SMR transporter [Endomicrobium sp.]|jgi:small multidrug resistance pump|nr:multidrug efflux SMR transporter [Endomicrobium sp.]
MLSVSKTAFFYLFIAIISEVFATSALKSCEGFTKLRPSLAVILGYTLSFWFFAKSLKGISLGMAYAIWAGAGASLIVIVGWAFYKQPMSAASLLGILLVIAGIIIMKIG